MKNIFKTFCGILGFSVTFPVLALSTIDLADVTTQFGYLETALVTVGGLIIIAAVVAVTYKWIKGMAFS